MTINVKKLAKISRPFKIILGAALVGYGYYSSNPWFYLGAIPLVSGIVGFCLLCKITRQCTITGKDI